MNKDEAIRKLARCLLPVHMGLAEQEMAGEPVPDAAVVLHFMGSGASDQVTAGEVRAALDAANAALTPEASGDTPTTPDAAHQDDTDLKEGGIPVLPLPAATALPSTSAETSPAWRPIETAPRDGRVFLAGCWPGRAVVRIVHFVYPDDRLPIGYSDANLWPVAPTHWMPLPDPPGVGSAEPSHDAGHCTAITPGNSGRPS